jgi:hypothetical protein
MSTKCQDISEISAKACCARNKKTRFDRRRQGKCDYSKVSVASGMTTFIIWAEPRFIRRRFMGFGLAKTLEKHRATTETIVRVLGDEAR